MRNQLGLVVFLFLLAAFLAFAEDGRDFTAYFQVSKPLDLGDEVFVTVTVRVVSFSSRDVIGATATLEDFFPPAKSHGVFPGLVSLPSCMDTVFEGEFTVPKANYEQWQRGANPALHLDFYDATGDPVRELIGLIRIGGEEE